MPRTLARLTMTLVSTSLLLMATALPALAAAGTKPDPDENPWLVGSLEQLTATAIVGVLVGFLVMALRAPGPDETDEGH